jgi:Na+/proline symporter
MLGAFVLGVVARRATAAGVIAGMSVSAAAMIVIWATTRLAWTWYVLVGFAICWTVGYLTSMRSAEARQPART